MERCSTLQQAAAMKDKLFDEGILDDQFSQLEEIYGDPNSVEELITWSIEEAEANIGIMERSLEKAPTHDFIEIGKALHKMKGTTASIGARKVLTKVNEMREQCKINSLDGCKASLQELKREQTELQEKLKVYFQMKKRQAGAA